jgi:hypothetical protein
MARAKRCSTPVLERGSNMAQIRPCRLQGRVTWIPIRPSLFKCLLVVWGMQPHCLKPKTMLHRLSLFYPELTSQRYEDRIVIRRGSYDILYRSIIEQGRERTIYHLSVKSDLHNTIQTLPIAPSKLWTLEA